MVVKVMHVEKNMVDNVLLDGGSRVNAITNGLRQKLRFPPPPNQFHSTYEWLIFHSTNPLGIIPNIRIKIHGITYIITFTMMNNKVMDPTYSMLLKHPWLRDAKVIHDWGTNVVTI
jgi:hypothetical protein